MDKHLANVERVAKEALEQFKNSGMKFNETFMEYFVKESNKRFKQACKRYSIEAKLKIPLLASKPKKRTNKGDPKCSTDVEKKKKNSTVVNKLPQKLIDSKNGKATKKVTKRQSDATDGTAKKRKPTETAQNNTSAKSISTASNIPTVMPSRQTRPENGSTGTTSSPTTIFGPNYNHQRQAAVTPLHTGLSVPNRRPEHITELFEQQELAKNVFIDGLSSDLNIRNPYEIFHTFCRKLGYIINHKDIEGIVQRPDGIIVKFYELQTKEWFVSKTKGLQVWIHELVSLPMPIALAPWAVYVQEG